MALCALCSQIPFASLPAFPSRQGMTRVNDSKESPVLWLRPPGEADSTPPGPLGFAWHKDLSTLALSAQSCALCGIIQDGVKEWLSRMENAAKSPSFAEFHGDHEPVPEGQQLFLTKRHDDAPGLLVLAPNPARSSQVYLLTGVSFAVDEKNTFSKALALRPMDRDSGSPSSLDVAAKFFHTCTNEHGQCDNGDYPLPSRILGLGEAGDTIKLVDETQGLVGGYACLSYCWGDVSPFTASHGSIEARRAGICVSNLPKTYRDAVKITRHLGLRYLWIDALCVCQEDSEDWARDSVRMINIYSRARLVIAANRASNATQGCFHIRPARSTRTINLPGYADNVQVQSVYNSEETGLGDLGDLAPPTEPLSCRAWALQERALARRVLHFSERQMYFECSRGAQGEDGCSYATNFLLASTQEWSYPKARAIWGRLLWHYGSRRFTKATDKLPAMSGLASFIGQKLQSEYIAGLWSTDLISGLMWQGLGDRRGDGRPQAVSPEQYIAPTWSWASYAGIAATPMHRSEGLVPVVEILEWDVKLKTEANPYGEIESAWLRLRAPVTPLLPSTVETTDHEARLRRTGHTPLPRLRTRYTANEEGQVLKFDYEEYKTSGKWRKMDLYVMVLGGHKFEAVPTAHAADNKGEQQSNAKESEKGTKEFQACNSFYGLVLTRSGSHDDTELAMERVGWLFLDGEEARALIGDTLSWKTVTLF